MMKVSVIIPVYNAENTLARALDSLLAQSMPQDEFEVIAINDVSTDRSLGILRYYRSKFKNFRLINNIVNRSQGSSRDQAITIACGKYIAGLDSGDFYSSPTALELLYRTAETNKADIVRFNYCQVEEGSMKELYVKNDYKDASLHKEELISSYLATKLSSAPWAFFISRDFILHQKINNPDTPHGDMFAALRYYIYSNGLVFLTENLYTCVKVSGSCCHSVNDLVIKTLVDVIKDRLFQLNEFYQYSIPDHVYMAFIKGTYALIGYVHGRIIKYSPYETEKNRLLSLMEDTLKNIDMLCSTEKEVASVNFLSFMPIKKSNPHRVLLPTEQVNISVSIIMPTLNNVKSVEKTLLSILNQDYPFKEIVVIDSESNDGTIEILKKYGSKINILVSVKDSGIYEAMNKGISLCSGDFILFINDDRFAGFDSLSKLVEPIKQYNAHVVVGQTTIVDHNNAFVRNRMNYIDERAYFKGQPFGHQAMLYRKSLHNIYGLYDTVFEVVADYNFISSLFDAGVEFYEIPYTTAIFVAGDGKSTSNDARWLREQLSVLKKYLYFLPESELSKFEKVWTIPLQELKELQENYGGQYPHSGKGLSLYINERLKREVAVGRTIPGSARVQVCAKEAKQLAIILGNGPSLQGVDFKESFSRFTTFGMNAAYRYWDRIGWYPDYYACLDLVVGLSHREEIIRLITNAEQYGIKQFLLRDNLIQTLGELQSHPRVVNFEKCSAIHPYLSNNKITTGSHTCGWAAYLGFTEIVLMGIDSNYVEIISEAQSIGGAQLEIVETPQSNPNYFFDDYQQKGDKYHIPNHTPQAPVHRVSWEHLAAILSDDNILVLNANMDSKLTFFHKMLFEDVSIWISQHKKAEKFYENFPRHQQATLNEDALLLDYFRCQTSTMIEVGAHWGGGTKAHLERGWKAYAFESDDANRAKCVTNTLSHEANLTLDERAVSDVSGQELPFYVSAESTGISTLVPFRNGHTFSKIVKTVTLADYIEEQSISQVDYLKIDAEGFDLMVLKGFPFDKFMPKFILCEFEDLKTVPLGYTMVDMADFLVEKGYYVYVSEWHPIIRSGAAHDWRRFFEYPAPTVSSNAWGNLLAFKEKPLDDVLQLLLSEHVKFRTVPPPNDYDLLFLERRAYW